MRDDDLRHALAIQFPHDVEDFIDELRVCLHGCGAANLLALRRRGVTKL